MKGVQGFIGKEKIKKGTKRYNLETVLAAFAFIILYLNQNCERCLSTDSMTQEAYKRKIRVLSVNRSLVTSPDASGIPLSFYPKLVRKRFTKKPVSISCLPVNRDREHWACPRSNQFLGSRSQTGTRWSDCREPRLHPGHWLRTL